MIDGLYRVRYETPAGEGSCVCILQAGQILGGGQVLYCIGTYVKRGNKFVGELHARKHAKSGKTSPILGMDEFHMRLEGTFHGGYGQIDGKIVELPNVPKLRGNFLRISAL